MTFFPKLSKKNLGFDLVAGFSVFLIAMPLCLGIAIASHFPPVAGLITAIIGGLIATFFGSAKLSIKGPAAGLIVIALGAVTELGQGDLTLGYKQTLAVGVIAAFLQILLALFKKAVIAEIMPTAIIHGMMAAIGVIIISQQSHMMLGVTPTTHTPFSLLQELPQSILNLNRPLLILSLLTIAICLIWPKIKILNKIPASLIVIAIAIGCAVFLKIDHHFLIQIPNQILNAITFPDFSNITSFVSLKYIVMLTLVGSIESLLSVCAIDEMTTEANSTNLNHDLFSVGVGNLICSLLGGLPMISEIVRSKANIDYEAKSQYSNFFHGLFLLLAVTLIPDVIQLIPKSALAALLVLTGFRLASPREFYHMFKSGKDQFLFFITTFIVTLLSDLLIGVIAGLAIKFTIHLIRIKSLRNLFILNIKTGFQEKSPLIQVKGALIFTHFLQLKKSIDLQTLKTKHVILDLKQTHLIDQTMQNKLKLLQKQNPNLEVQL